MFVSSFVRVFVRCGVGCCGVLWSWSLALPWWRPSVVFCNSITVVAVVVGGVVVVAVLVVLVLKLLMVLLLVVVVAAVFVVVVCG